MRGQRARAAGHPQAGKPDDREAEKGEEEKDDGDEDLYGVKAEAAQEAAQDAAQEAAEEAAAAAAVAGLVTEGAAAAAAAVVRDADVVRLERNVMLCRLRKVGAWLRRAWGRSVDKVLFFPEGSTNALLSSTVPQYLKK